MKIKRTLTAVIGALLLTAGVTVAFALSKAQDTPAATLSGSVLTDKAEAAQSISYEQTEEAASETINAIIVPELGDPPGTDYAQYADVDIASASIDVVADIASLNLETAPESLRAAILQARDILLKNVDALSKMDVVEILGQSTSGEFLVIRAMYSEIGRLVDVPLSKAYFCEQIPAWERYISWRNSDSSLVP